MKSRYRIFKIKGVSIYLHISCLAIPVIALVGLLLNGWIQSSVLFIIYFSAGMMVAQLTHELGHAWAGSWFGINAKTLTLYPLTGIGSIEKLPDNPKQELLISLAGPAFNCLLAAVLFFYSHEPERLWDLVWFSSAISTDPVLLFAIINLLIGLVNLLPVFPFDGGRILRALIGFRYNYFKSTMLVKFITIPLSVLVVIAGGIVLNPLIVAAGMVGLLLAREEEQYLRLKSLLTGLALKDVLIHDYRSVQDQDRVRDITDSILNSQCRYFIVLDGARPVGTLSRMDVIKESADMHYDRNVKEFMTKPIQCLSASQGVDEVIDKLSKHRHRIYPVTENGYFKGVVSFERIMEYLLLTKAKTADYPRARAMAVLA